MDAMLDYEGRAAVVRALIGEESFAGAWAEGKAMTCAEGVEYALSKRTAAAQHNGAREQPATGNRARGLTRREREVAALLSQGLTNREVASELFVSGRTVEAHVHNILKKLGLSSRAQIATWMIEQRTYKTT